MKDHLKGLVASAGSGNRARNLVREYLQARILESLQRQGAFSNWAFLGGTALRFLFDMPRFSEDLDFSLRQAGTDCGFIDRMQSIKTVFAAEGYAVSVKAKDERTVQSAFVRFEGLLHELGLSPHAGEAVSVKIEIDTNPPAGAGTATTIVRRHVLLNLLHHDQASLLAGKLHALLMRPHVKGRDVYDLVWYLADRRWPEPNLVLLNNSLAQTGWQRPALTSSSWRDCLGERLRGFDFKQVVADVMPFIEREPDLELLNLASITGLLAR